MSIIHNSSKLNSKLEKKCDATAQHAVLESVAMKESLMEHIRSDNNPADLLTKVKIDGKENKHSQHL